jgi:AraC family transcriptional regulator
VEKHFEARLTLKQLAAVAHLSVYHLARQFQAATGLPPHHDVIMRRVERAKEFLRGGDDLSRAQVAARSGLRDQGHFTRPFQRLAGVTPKRFR